MGIPSRALQECGEGVTTTREPSRTDDESRTRTEIAKAIRDSLILFGNEERKDKEPYSNNLDIGIYLPQQFRGPRGDLPVLAFSPAFDNLVSRVANQETRLIGVDIIALVNITPYFTASPTEAYGERQLSQIIRGLRNYLTQQKHVNLDGRVRYFSVNDVKWAWLQRKDMSLRAAALEVSVEVTVQRQSS